MTRYTNIIARLESARGPDRELDALVHFTIELHDASILVRAGEEKYGGLVREFWVSGTSGLWDDELPLFTASLDAAIGLAERVLPGCSAMLTWGEPYPHPRCQFAPLSKGERRPYDAAGHTLPLALLLALFRALEAQEAGE